ncbi:MAG: sensor domain-containing diguanylate cyclase [Candidatus Devosia phytovorans]|uniref:Sensor domain-containing diguanylate cyclase n=1 Tax=Candidatus Devosia phytovorans TaxID=3121372 RepID=A0AAJ6B3D4_9HYPH|nr:sensor domain-containing diguanylate cyclase [Devosia sp.]WEK06308.1 MAG: sensor domain-containing diguanylate cyclase [Devosia sp.]
MSTITASPQSGHDATGDLDPRLQRLCALLGVTGARLSVIKPTGAEVIGQHGPFPDNLTVLETTVSRTGRSRIIADTGADSPGLARFYIGLLIESYTGSHGFILSLFDNRPRSRQMADHLAMLAREATALHRIEHQKHQLEIQQRTITDFEAVEEHRRSLFDRASATARIGIWQCNLADHSITWTNGVYDIFEIPRDEQISRASTLSLYTDDSRQRMETARAAAIANCSDFSVDCEIVTRTGKHRWMRLTGAVESRDGVAYRIFGMKQDITEEKLMGDQTRFLAEHDVMTGLANRSQFQSRLSELDQGRHTFGAMLLVDLDGFKQVNDTYGHAVGDECLRQAARRLRECADDAGLVARIGGDEFALLLRNGMTETDVKAIADRIVALIAQPFLHHGHKMVLGASVGFASYTGGSAEDLFRQADTALYAAKAAGRNTSRSFIANAA